MLVEAGVTDKEQLDKIMRAYGAGLNNARAELEAQNETLRNQLEQQTNKLDELAKNNEANKLDELAKSNEANAETKKALEELQAEYSHFKQNSEVELARINKNNAIALALKDVKAYDSDVLMKLIDIDKIELDEAGKPKLDEVVNGLKESKPFLFQQEQEQQQPQIVVGGTPNGNGTQATDPFQAVIDSYK